MPHRGPCSSEYLLNSLRNGHCPAVLCRQSQQFICEAVMQVSVFLTIAWLGIGVLWLPIMAYCVIDPATTAKVGMKPKGNKSGDKAPLLAFQVWP